MPGIRTQPRALDRSMPSSRARIAQFNRAFKDLTAIHKDVREQGAETMQRWRPMIRRKPFVHSARNLADYLSLRRHDLRALQAILAPLGLSTLGRCEARVLPTIEALLSTLGVICVKEAGSYPPPSPRAMHKGMASLLRETGRVLGPAPRERNVRIMVTLPETAGSCPALIRGLLKSGMNVARINCAHGDQDVWKYLVKEVRGAALELRTPCRIFMDLGGPKVRTGSVVHPKGEKSLVSGTNLLVCGALQRSDTRFPWQAVLTLPRVLDHVKVGEHVWIDDGQIGGVVESIGEAGAIVRITQVPPGGRKLKPDKGVNFPDTRLSLPALTDKDREDLIFVKGNADIIGYSFVQSKGDMSMLHEALGAIRGSRYRHPAVVAKIETQEAIDNLPEIIVQGAGHGAFGVMIARGDLAVEIGFPRLAEMQEEILWICEAAHVPVIWATQVLESFTKRGTLSRAEMTDAAMSQRAECVMLNKGPYQEEATSLLDDVLRRMQGHQNKKNPQLRNLGSW